MQPNARTPHPIAALVLCLLATLQPQTSHSQQTPHPPQQTLKGKVISIADGDTITIYNSQDNQKTKIRVSGIDAPEKSQDYGQQSKQNLSDCAFGKDAEIQWTKQDRYKRTIGKVIINGTDCGLKQIKDGLAWHYKAYERDQSPSDRESYSQAEKQARNSKIGLWSQPQPTPPWDYRRAQKNQTDPN